MKPEISVVIPTLNEAGAIAKTLDALAQFDKTMEIIVVDDGSSDATLEIIQNYDAKILHGKRGSQLQTGAEAAGCKILWFVHADTLPAPDAIFQIKRALENPRIVGGNFTIRFDGERFAAKFLTWLYPKLNLLGLIYGDSAIFVRREIYQKIGGFKSETIFEDLDFVGRLKKEGEIITLPSVVVTSSRKFENKSFLLTFARWTILQILYWLGVAPDTLLKIYFPEPNSNAETRTK